MFNIDDLIYYGYSLYLIIPIFEYNMKIPISISPNNIKDSVIEVRYTSETPFEVLVGLFFKALDDTYYFTTRPVPKSKNVNDAAIKLSTMPQINFTPGSYLFFNDHIKLSIHPNKLIFNCLNEYLGWEKYYAEIEQILTQLSKIEDIKSYVRASARYISEYQQTSLETCVNFNFTFGMPEVKSSTYKFHSEFKLNEDSRVILNLNSDVPALTGFSTNEMTPISTIDIDVITEGVNVISVKEILDLVQKVHDTEKQIFFKILKEDFLKTLNPKY